MFPKGGPPKGDREMSIAELRARADEIRAQGQFPHNQLFEIHKKFSIPAACLVFGLIGLALGATNRRDGKLASFVIGVAIVFVYYILLWLGQALTKGQLLAPWLAAWLPNIVLGVAGILLFKLARSRRPIVRCGSRCPRCCRRLGTVTAHGRSSLFRPIGHARPLRRAHLPAHAGLSALALCSVFYISTFTELTEKVLKGAATWTMLWTFLVYQTPQYLLLHHPAVGAAGDARHRRAADEEQRARRDEGVRDQPVPRGAADGRRPPWSRARRSSCSSRPCSGLRTAAPRRSSHVMRGGSPETFDVLNRRWVMGSDGDIYHYNYFDPRSRKFTGLWIYEFNADMTRLTRRTFAQQRRLRRGRDVAGRERLDAGVRRDR